MIFFFNAKGDLLDRTNENVYQNSNNASRIWFAMPIPKTSVVSIGFTLPNGEYAKLRAMTPAIDALPDYKDEFGNPIQFWYYDLLTDVTAYAGNTEVQFNVVVCDKTITTKGVNITVLKGTPISNLPAPPNEYQAIISALESLNSIVTNIREEVDSFETETTENLNEKFDGLETSINNKFNELEKNSTASQVIQNTNNIKALFNLQLNKNVLAYDNADFTEEIQQTGGTDLSGLTILDNSYANVNKISGNTVKCENLINIDAMVATGGDIYTDALVKNNDGSYTITKNGYTRFSKRKPCYIPAGKYTYSGTLISKTDGITGIGVRWFAKDNNTVVLNNTWYFDWEKVTIEFSADVYYVDFYLNGNLEDGSYITFKNLMLNAGETALPYQPYFNGLKNAQTSGIKSTGRNFFNSEMLLKAEGWTENNGVYSGNGIKLYHAFGKAKGGFFGELNLDKQVALSFWGKNSTLSDNTSAFGFLYTDGTENNVRVISTEWTKYTLVSEAGKIIKCVYATLFEQDTVSLKEVCMKFGANEFDYEPYTESVMSLPKTVELGKWDYIENGQIVRQTSDFLELNGTENWVLTQYGFRANFIEIGAKIAVSSSIRDNVISSYYPYGLAVDKSLFVNGDSLYIMDNTYTTEYEWKTHLAELYASGNPLTIAYKLATPTYTPITFDNQYLVWDKGMELKEGNANGEFGASTNAEIDYLVIVGGND